MPRRVVLASLLAALVLVARLPATAQARSVGGPPATYLTDLARAEAAAQAMQTYFSAGNGLYRETYPNTPYPSYAWLWSYSQAMAATADLDALTGGARGDMEQALQALALYWHNGRQAYNASVRPPLGIEANTYYDDNGWAGLDLLTAYEATGDPTALAQAERVFSFLQGGWASYAPCGGLAGGVYWMDTSADLARTTTATAGGAALGLGLYLITRDPAYLTWAEQMDSWIEANLRDPSDGLYWDHISPGAGGQCRTDTDKVTYNQGVMIEVTLLLAQATANEPLGHWEQSQLYAYYLDRAEAIASAAMQGFNGQYAGQDPAFTAILLQALAQLYPLAATAPGVQRAILATLRGYGTWAWQTVRDPATNLFWFTPSSGVVPLLDQAAMVRTYSLLAQLDLLQVTSACAHGACAAASAPGGG